MASSSVSDKCTYPNNCTICNKPTIKTEFSYACTDPNCILSMGKDEYTRMKLNLWDRPSNGRR